MDQKNTKTYLPSSYEQFLQQKKKNVSKIPANSSLNERP